MAKIFAGSRFDGMEDEINSRYVSSAEARRFASMDATERDGWSATTHLTHITADGRVTVCGASHVSGKVLKRTGRKTFDCKNCLRRLDAEDRQALIDYGWSLPEAPAPVNTDKLPRMPLDQVVSGGVYVCIRGRRKGRFAIVDPYTIKSEPYRNGRVLRVKYGRWTHLRKMNYPMEGHATFYLRGQGTYSPPDGTDLDTFCRDWRPVDEDLARELTDLRYRRDIGEIGFSYWDEAAPIRNRIIDEATGDDRDE